MAGIAVGDLSMLPESVKKIESSSNGGFHKALVEHSNENAEEKERSRAAAPLVEVPANGNESLSYVLEVASAEVEYIDSENLSNVEDVDTCVKTLVGGLESKEWVVVCEALNNVRRLSLFHKDLLSNMLGDVIPLVVKSLKNPRSAVCKTAIMTSEDIFKAYNDHMIASLDSLLVQLLLKASQDKRFVCEAAERTLIAMTTWVSPTLLLPKLQPYLKNRNPRIRAKASMCFCRSVLRLGLDGINAYGLDKLIHIAASQLSDQLPESREAARTLLLELQAAYGKTHVSPAATPEDQETTLPEDQESALTKDQEIKTWDHFCQSNLSPLSAQAVLRVTSISREGLVLDS